MRIRTLVLAFVLTTATAAAQDLPSIAVGGHSPHLQIATWLDGKASADTYQDRYTLVHFFAPWSEASLQQFAQLEALQAALGDKLVFVSIADAPRADVEAIMSRFAPKSRVAIDDEGKTFFAYGVRRLPHVVLTDTKGRVMAKPKLESVTTKVLEQLVAGEQIGLPNDPDEPADLEWDRIADAAAIGADPAQAHCFIGPTAATSGGVRFPPRGGRIVADGLAFANLVQLAYGATAKELLSAHPETRNFARRYRVSVRAADDQPETARTMLRERVERTFACSGQWIDTTTKVTVLRRQPGKEVVAAVASAGQKVVKLPVARLADTLRARGLGKEVVDETGLARDQVLELAWTAGDAKSLPAALEAYGLRVVTEDRPVRRLQLRPTGK